MSTSIGSNPIRPTVTLREGALANPVEAATITRVKEEYSDQADVYNASRNVGNKVSDAVTGVTGHVAGNVGLLLPTVGETYKNLWKAETIGPYAKFVGSIVALAGIPMVAAGALLASPFQGVAEAFKETSDSENPLVQDSTAEVAARITSKETKPSTLLGKAIVNMREFGDKKLGPNEEPWDIPVDKILHGALDGINFLMVKVPVQAAKLVKRAAVLAKDSAIEGAKLAKKGAVNSAKFVKEYGPKLCAAAVAGTVSTLIAGPAGLVIGVGISVALAAKDVKAAFTDKDRSLGSRVGGVAKTLAYAPVGPVMAGLAVKENFTRSFSEGWDGHPVEAIKTTTRAVMEKAREALHGQKETEA